MWNRSSKKGRSSSGSGGRIIYDRSFCSNQIDSVSAVKVLVSTKNLGSRIQNLLVMNQSACIQTCNNTLTMLDISHFSSFFSSIQRTMASTMLGVRRKGTISGRASDSPLSKRQSKSQFMFSAFVVSIRTFSVWRSPRPVVREGFNGFNGFNGFKGFKGFKGFTVFKGCNE